MLNEEVIRSFKFCHNHNLKAIFKTENVVFYINQKGSRCQWQPSNPLAFSIDFGAISFAFLKKFVCGRAVKTCPEAGIS